MVDGLRRLGVESAGQTRRRGQDVGEMDQLLGRGSH